MIIEKNVGIYKIENSLNNQVYIGSSTDIEKRIKQHKYRLRKDVHENQYLQRAWNKYGEENFVFLEIMELPFNSLIEREQYWIDYYRKYGKVFNLDLRVIDTDSKLRREKISNSLKKIMGGNMNPRYKKVSKRGVKIIIKKYLQGYPINNYKIYGYGHSVILRILRENNVRIRKYGENLKGKMGPKARKVNQYDLHGNLIKEWKSITSAAKTLRICRDTIGNSCRMRTKGRKYTWKYKM